jgi:carboxypeptidase Q
MESDLGPWWVYGFSSRVPPAKLPVIRALLSVIEPLGVEYLGNEASGDADVGQLYALGVPVFDLRTDATRYFDLHHTPNDTFDKIDPQQLRHNVACYAALAYLVADLDGDLGRAPRAEKPAAH